MAKEFNLTYWNEKKGCYTTRLFKTFKDAYEYATNKLHLHEFDIQGTRYYKIYSQEV